MTRPISEFASEGGIKALIEKGRKRGYLTIEEILDILPSDISDNDQVDDIILMIEGMGIEVAK